MIYMLSYKLIDLLRVNWSAIKGESLTPIFEALKHETDYMAKLQKWTRKQEN